MPFELGMACAISRFLKHDWLVFEARSFRIQKSLSDLNGFDPYIHGGRPRGVLNAVTNAFVRAGRSQPTVMELMKVYRSLEEGAKILKRVNATGDLYNARGFKDLVSLATELTSALSRSW